MKDALISKNLGFSTLELLIAITIITTALSAVVIVVFGNQTVSLDNQINNEALLRANDIIEEARSSASFDFNSLAYSSSSEDIFRKELIITDVNPCKKTGIASISWAIEQNRPSQIEIETVFANPTEAVALSGDCGPDNPPVTEWWFPFTFQDYDLKSMNPLSMQSGNAGVGATSVDVVGKNGSKYVILTTRHSAEKDIWVINVDDGLNAFIAGSLETGVSGLNNADNAGDYVFALTAGSYAEPSELQIINVGTMTSPGLVATKSLEISGSTAQYLPNANAIFSYGAKVYVGTHETSGREFKIFNAVSPFNLIGSLEITHNVNDIVVSGDYAYLATSDNSGELMIININPSSADYLRHPDVTGMKYDATGDYDGISLFVMGDKAYLGRAGGNYVNTDASNLVVLDVDNPYSIILLGSKFIKDNAGPNKATSVIAQHIVGTFAFLATDDEDTDFQVYRSGNPANIYNCDELNDPSYPADCGLYNFPQKMVDLEYDENLIYGAILSNATFRIIFDDETQY